MTQPQDLQERDALISKYLAENDVEQLEALYQSEKPTEAGPYRTLFFPEVSSAAEEWVFVVIRYIKDTLWVFHDLDDMKSPLPLADRFWHGNLWKKDLE